MIDSFRFFVSFSSLDLKFVREIMAALHGQELDFWDYSDIIQSIELGENINDRLFSEIDACTHMVVVISRNSLDSKIGHFCRLELEYALNQNSKNPPQLLPVLIDGHDELTFKPPYDIFKNKLCLELEDSAASVVQFTVKVCQAIDKVYIPPIEAHPNLPFWKSFRKEVIYMAHSNKEHIDIMTILGEFNEHYKKVDNQQALALIRYFLQSCEFKIPSYKPFYPRIVKAICETELKKYDEAMKSLSLAEKIHPDDKHVLGGYGTIFFKTGHYQKAAECFEKIINDKKNDDNTYARINLIITYLAMDKEVSVNDAEFLFQLDISGYSPDLQTAISNAKAIFYRLKKDYTSLEKLCKEIINDNLHDTITIRLYQLSYLNRWMKNEATEVINFYIKEAEINPKLDRSELVNYLND